MGFKEKMRAVLSAFIVAEEHPDLSVLGELGRIMPARGYIYCGQGMYGEHVWSDENRCLVYAVDLQNGALALSRSLRGRILNARQVRTVEDVREFAEML